MQLFDGEKSSNFPQELPYLQDATEELGEGNDKRYFCAMCPHCHFCGK